MSSALYRPDGSGGYNETKLAPSDGSRYFGASVAVSDNTIAVGADSDDTAGSNSGAVYVYRPDGSGGYDETKLVASDAAVGDNFGAEVAVSERRIYAVGGGDLYVFTPDSSGGYAESKITASDGVVLGTSIAVSGDTIVVGQSGDTDAGIGAGAVYVFTPDRSGGYEETKLTASDATDYGGLGRSVGVSGNTIVAGTNSEAAYVFVPARRGGYRETKLTASDGSAGFGNSVGISGDRIVVGAPFDGHAGWVSGAAYLYTPDRSSGYKEAKITASDAASGEDFGWSVAISGRVVVVGAPVNDLANLLHSGSAYVFDS